jgi:hypothetical protein
MALSQAQLLKRKAKKKKARAEKSKSIQQESKLQYLSKWPIISAYAPFESRDGYTLQQALIVRQRPDGHYAVGMFLIDLLCLGVKNCFIKILPSYQLANFLENVEEGMPMDAVSPSYVATFIHKAVEYASSFGFKPEGDYQIMQEFLKGIPLDESLAFTFGENGKPVYVAGPHDSSEFVRKVMAKLDDAVGKDNYHYIIPMEAAD